MYIVIESKLHFVVQGIYISEKSTESAALVLLLERFHLYIHMSSGWYSSIHKVSYPWRNGIDCILTFFFWLIAFMTWYILRWMRCIANGILTILQFDFTLHIWYFIETNLGIYREQAYLGPFICHSLMPLSPFLPWQNNTLPYILWEPPK